MLGFSELAGGELASLLVVKVGVVRWEELLNRLRPPRSHPQECEESAQRPYPPAAVWEAARGGHWSKLVRSRPVRDFCKTKLTLPEENQDYKSKM
jgi:hypothetical protein